MAGFISSFVSKIKRLVHGTKRRTLPPVAGPRHDGTANVPSGVDSLEKDLMATHAARKTQKAAMHNGSEDELASGSKQHSMSRQEPTTRSSTLRTRLGMKTAPAPASDAKVVSPHEVLRRQSVRHSTEPIRVTVEETSQAALSNHRELQSLKKEDLITKIKLLQENYQNACHQITDLKNENFGLHSRQRDLQQRYDTLYKQLQTLQQDLHTAQNIARSEKEKTEVLKGQLRESKDSHQRHSQLYKQLQTTQQALHTAQKTAESEREKTTVLKGRLREIEDSHQRHLQQENNALKQLQTMQQDLYTAQETAENEREKAKALDGQLSEIKKTIAGSVNVPEQITDNVLKRDFSDLCNEVRDWAMKFFRKTTFAISADNVTDEQDHAKFGRLVSSYLSAGASRKTKMSFCMGIVAVMLTELANSNYFFGMSDNGAMGHARALSALLKPESLHNTKLWLHMTYKMLQAKAPDELAHAMSRLVEEFVQDTKQVFERLTGTCWNDQTEASFTRIVTTALEVLRKLTIQCAAYKVRLISIPNNDRTAEFDPDAMEHVSGRDASDFSHQHVAVCCFPTVLKYRDEDGRDIQPAHVVVKALADTFELSPLPEAGSAA
ncbi:hypothetical protein LTR66_005074 [Elasticomyces elasticus]|nr:hypothetical protein LTR66_005074 [Elasticomyces elasticus]